MVKRFLAVILSLIGLSMAWAVDADHVPLESANPLRFPVDYGSHPQFRTEWWYVTGWLKTQHGESLGFQITFFRTKTDVIAENPSAFAAHQLIIVHCAISDPKRAGLWQDQRIRRAGMGLVGAEENDTNVWADSWSLKRGPQGYVAQINGDDFSLNLNLADTQPVLVNGVAGVSRKGPRIESTSYYYSLPHLRVNGKISRNKSVDPVTGEAWFDHEWSNAYLDAEAIGWDWIGINLDDGAALMAFRIRGADGLPRWAGGTYRSADGITEYFDPSDVNFEAQRTWTSPRTGIVYPVQWRIRTGKKTFDMRPLLDDQENDTRLSTGAIYWEGAVDAVQDHHPVGRGYLELTGYGERLKLR